MIAKRFYGANDVSSLASCCKPVHKRAAHARAPRNGPLAQVVEQWILNPLAPGSSPGWPTTRQHVGLPSPTWSHALSRLDSNLRCTRPLRGLRTAREVVQLRGLASTSPRTRSPRPKSWILRGDMLPLQNRGDFAHLRPTPRFFDLASQNASETTGRAASPTLIRRALRHERSTRALNLGRFRAP